MKKLSFLHSAMVALMLAAAFTSCSKDNDAPQAGPEPDPTPQVNVHYDLTVTVGKHGGMGRDVTTILQTRSTLSEGDVLDYKNAGTEINADYTLETIVKGKYYYQVPVAGRQFVKLQYVNGAMTVVQAQPFKDNTFSPRNYTHAWINDNTLVIMAANGDLNKVIWTKLNTDDMTIIAEGELALTAPQGFTVVTTSGIAGYRKADNKLFYCYYWKTKKRNGVNEENFHVATINPETMAVEQQNVCPMKSETAATAYGELLQQTLFFDENDNMYLACFTDANNMEEGKLFRIKKGEFNFEDGYNGFPNSDGKLLTVQYLGNGKVFAYSRHDDSTLGTGIDDYVHYYSVIDLNNNTRTRMQFNGQDIPYSGGRFSQRSVFNSKENKVYFGVNTQNAQPQIYIYDVATGNVTEGIKVAEGYYFEQIRLLED